MSDEPTPEIQAAPVVKVARDLREIIELHEALLTQAVHKANDALMPGGLAMVSLADVAKPADWERRLELVEHEWITEPYAAIDEVDGWLIRPDDDKTRPALGVDEDPDWEPPLQTLLFWSEALRTERQADYEHEVTVKTEAKFISWELNWIWDHEPHWDDFAADINAVRRRLESILYDGDRADRTRVICNRDYCTKRPQLIRVYHERVLTAYMCRVCTAIVATTEDRDHCPSCWTSVSPEEVWYSEPLKDRWKCPACKHRYDDDEYQRAHGDMLRTEGADKFVHVRDAIATLISQGRGRRTVRRWLAPPIRHIEDRCTDRKCRTPSGKRRVWPPGRHEKCPACESPLKAVKRGDPEAVVEGWCDLATHETWVWWPTLWRMHQATRKRKRSVA